MEGFHYPEWVQKMEYRELGRTGMKVSKLSFGCATLTSAFYGFLSFFHVIVYLNFLNNSSLASWMRTKELKLSTKQSNEELILSIQPHLMQSESHENQKQWLEKPSGGYLEKPIIFRHKLVVSIALNRSSSITAMKEQ